MQILFIILVGLLCVQSSAQLSLEESYNRIDEHLARKVSHMMSMEANLAEAANWKRKLEQKSNKCLAFHRDSTCSLIDALDNFLSLADLVRPGACNEQSLEVVRVNARAAGLANVERPARRIEQIVRYYSRQHYKMCYPDTVSAKFETLEPESLEFLMNIGKPSLDSSPTRLATTCVELARENLAMGCEDTYFERYFEHKVTEDEFNQYLIRPCAELKQAMGADFDQDVSGDIKFYDLDLGEYRSLTEKRSALNNCQLILRHANEIYPNMLKQMDKQEA